MSRSGKPLPGSEADLGPHFAPFVISTFAPPAYGSCVYLARRVPSPAESDMLTWPYCSSIRVSNRKPQTPNLLCPPQTRPFTGNQASPRGQKNAAPQIGPWL